MKGAVSPSSCPQAGPVNFLSSLCLSAPHSTDLHSGHRLIGKCCVDGRRRLQTLVARATGSTSDSTRHHARLCRPQVPPACIHPHLLFFFPHRRPRSSLLGSCRTGGSFGNPAEQRPPSLQPLSVHYLHTVTLTIRARPIHSSGIPLSEYAPSACHNFIRVIGSPSNIHLHLLIFGSASLSLTVDFPQSCKVHSLHSIGPSSSVPKHWSPPTAPEEARSLDRAKHSQFQTQEDPGRHPIAELRVPF